MHYPELIFDLDVKIQFLEVQTCLYQRIFLYFYEKKGVELKVKCNYLMYDKSSLFCYLFDYFFTYILDPPLPQPICIKYAIENG